MRNLINTKISLSNINERNASMVPVIENPVGPALPKYVGETDFDKLIGGTLAVKLPNLP